MFATDIRLIAGEAFRLSVCWPILLKLGNRHTGREPMARDKSFKTRAPSGAEMRASLTKQLPAIKAKARTNAGKALTGRPVEYTEERGEKILALMSEGMTLTEACDALGIARSTVYRWAEREPFKTTFARARMALAEFAFSEAYAIPKRLLAEYETKPDLKMDPAKAQVARLATSTLQWYAERLAPDRYAPKQPEAPSLVVNNNSLTVDSRALSPDQRSALREALLAAKAVPIASPDEEA